MRGHSPLEHEDGGGPAGDGLPTWEGCRLHHDPPDIPDPGGGVSGVGWALEGITAATRGARLSRSQPSTSTTTSPGTVVPAVTGFRSAPSSRAASVPRSQAKDSPPPQKHKKLATALREKGKTTATKGSPRTTVGGGKTAAPPSKVGKGQRKKGKSPPTCTADKTDTGTATCTAATSTASQDTTSTASQDTAATSTAAQDTAATSTAAQTPPPPTQLPRTPPPPAPLPRSSLPAARSLSHPPAPLANERRKHRRY
ncbi:hypothetical protein NDU88_003915 [Pleurodeles waltl]|uniref:Uncharacterized protein n=1 Tax=Pleurodeles waltl TaxID=8319 RepID=A0AAV7PDI6_PLEWA|nr:hypothetical protein NDU88_003915 [Pleurodeles waltl]